MNRPIAATFTLCIFTQSYNGGTAPFPYATQCTATVTSGTCDPANLVSEMAFASEADPIIIGVVAADDDFDAVKLVMNRCIAVYNYMGLC